MNGDTKTNIILSLIALASILAIIYISDPIIKEKFHEEGIKQKAKQLSTRQFWQ